MNNILKNFHIVSAIFVMVLGTILHFTYDWSGKNSFVALFSAINESTWEHLKLIFFPMLLTSILGYIFFKSVNCYWCARAIGMLVSLTFTLAFFYTYSGVLGKNIAIIDIISFFISVILGELTSYILMNNNIPCNKSFAFLFIVSIASLFVLFTFNPPNIGLFKDPIDGSYGIKNNSRLYFLEFCFLNFLDLILPGIYKSISITLFLNPFIFKFSLFFVRYVNNI